MFSWCSRSGSACLLFRRMTSVFAMLIWSPVFLASSVTRHSFSCASCASCGLWERRLVLFVKSSSSSCFTKVHWMPVLSPGVDCFLTQSTTVMEIAGERKPPWLTPVCTLKGSVSLPSWMSALRASREKAVWACCHSWLQRPDGRSDSSLARKVGTNVKELGCW